MGATGFVRCPSLPQNVRCLARQPSLTGLKRSHSAFAAVRRPSLKCDAVQKPAQNDPEFRPDVLSSDSEWDFDLDAQVMPWTAGLPRFEDSKTDADPFPDGPLMFYPTSQQQHLESEDGQDNTPEARTTEADAPCYVILFGVGEVDVEGIYTLRTTDVDQESSSPTAVDTVVAFQNEVDALRFSTLLEASLAYKPSVYPISWADVTEWCNDTNTRIRLEPAGSLLIPPESNVEKTDWERAIALQRGDYTVLDSEPVLPEDDASPTDFFFSPSSLFGNGGGGAATGTNNNSPFFNVSDDFFDVQEKLASSGGGDSVGGDDDLSSAREQLERSFNL